MVYLVTMLLLGLGANAMLVAFFTIENCDNRSDAFCGRLILLGGLALLIGFFASFAVFSSGCSGDFKARWDNKPPRVERSNHVIGGASKYTPAPSIVPTATETIDRPMEPQLERLAEPIKTAKVNRIQYFYGRVVLRLSWETPGDDDTTDACGTDIDLHVIPMQGEWGEEPGVWYSNPDGYWPPSGKVNNFALTEDVLNNERAEYVTGRWIQRDQHFLVAVHYYSNQGNKCSREQQSVFGSVTFTLQFWVDGERKYAPMRRIEHDEFWVGFEANGAGDYWKISRRFEGIAENPR